MQKMLRRLAPLSVALVAVIWLGPAQGHHGSGSLLCDACQKVTLRFDPAFARAAPGPQAPAGGGGRAQPGEEWDGTALPPDPLGLLDLDDTHEFQALSTYDNTSLTATVIWNAGPGLAYDLDLYVERRDPAGNWVEVGRSTNGQALGDGEAQEVAQVTPISPGAYRARVVNWASTEVAYHGEIGFTSSKGTKKPSTGRALEDRPDLTELPRLHAIYMIPSDGQDNTLDTNGVIEESVATMNVWLEQQTGKHLRLDTYLDRKTPRLDVSFVKGNLTAAEYSNSDHPDGAFGEVTQELEDRGWLASPAIKRYLVFYDGVGDSPNTCGTAYVSTLNDFAQWSVLWLGSSAGCGARDFGTPETGGGMSEAISLHELFHNEGLVPLGALHQCWAFQFHLCSAAAGAVLDTLDPEAVDLLFPFVTYPLRDKVVDRGRDDYYGHPFPHRDMDTTPFLED